MWYSHGPMARSTGPHDEVQAMRQLSTALEPLTPEERARVLRWAAEKFQVSLPRGGTAQDGKDKGGERKIPPGEPQEPVEFYAEAAPESDTERALVMAYWCQVVRGDREFTGHSVHSQLKQLGHGVSNITQALTLLKERKPQLVIQLQKSGKSKQARKRYKVTGAGIAEVRRMLSSRREE